MLLSIFYFCFVQISLLIPGYVLVKKTRLFSKQPGIELSVGYFIMLVLFAFLATIDYAFKFNSTASRLISWLLILYTLVELVRLRYFKDLLKLRFPLICLIAMSLFANLFLSLSYSSRYSFVPDPTPQTGANYQVLNVKVLNIARTQANDNYVPYRQAQFFINRSDPGKDSFIGEWGVGFFERTPLMGAVTANYFNLFNDKPPINFLWSPDANDPDHTYQKFQILAGTLNYLFIIPAFFLLSRLFNRKTAVVTSLLLIPSQFFLFNDFFSWPKSLVAFFIFTSWLLLLEKKPKFTVFAGIVSGAAYLTHDLAILYIGASFLFLLINKRFRELIFFSVPVAISAAPWFIAANLIYHRPSSFIYYPISTGGIPQLQYKHQIIHTFFHTSPLRLLKIRLDNLFYLLSPYQLLSSEGGQTITKRLIGLGQFSIFGALGLGLIIPAYIAAFKKIKGWLVWVFILTPVILSVIIIGWPKGLGALHFAETIVVLLSGLGVSWLLKLKSWRWLMLAYIINTAQLVFFIAYSYSFALGVWFTNASDIISISLIACLAGGCGWLIYKSTTGQSTWITGKA